MITTNCSCCHQFSINCIEKINKEDCPWWFPTNVLEEYYLLLLNKDQINQCVPVALAMKHHLIRGKAGNQVCFISLKHGLNTAKKPSPSSTPTALWNISLHVHNSPIPLWTLSKMKEIACTGALSAPLALSFSAHSLWNREKKKKVNTQAAPALFNHFTPPALISLQQSNGSKSRCLRISGFSPSFTLVWLAHSYLLV